MPAPTIRAIARELGLSRTTVSEALRGLSRVRPETTRKIREKAQAMGYRPNPLASAVMSEIRRSHAQLFRGGLAAVDFAEADRPDHSVRFHAAIIEGGRTRAAELGYNLQTFIVDRKRLTVERLDRILQSRGIHGVFLLPAWQEPDISRLDWTQYAGIYTDYMIERPALHSISCDHYRSMIGALERLTRLGYRRPGVFLHRHHDERLQHRWEGAFLAYQNNRPELKKVPTLILDTFERAPFIRWFKRYRPDVVLGHWTPAIEWMKECGGEVPGTAGFVCLNVSTEPRECAGLDFRPKIIGARGVEQLIAQLQRNERGIPSPASITMIAALWRDGPTLAPRNAGAAAGL